MTPLELTYHEKQKEFLEENLREVEEDNNTFKVVWANLKQLLSIEKSKKLKLEKMVELVKSCDSNIEQYNDRIKEGFRTLIKDLLVTGCGTIVGGIIIYLLTSAITVGGIAFMLARILLPVIVVEMGFGYKPLKTYLSERKECLDGIREAEQIKEENSLEDLEAQLEQSAVVIEDLKSRVLSIEGDIKSFNFDISVLKNRIAAVDDYIKEILIELETSSRCDQTLSLDQNNEASISL